MGSIMTQQCRVERDIEIGEDDDGQPITTTVVVEPALQCHAFVDQGFENVAPKGITQFKRICVLVPPGSQLRDRDRITSITHWPEFKGSYQLEVPVPRGNHIIAEAELVE